MSLDRFIRFPHDAPDEDAVQGVLENFVGDLAAVSRVLRGPLHSWTVELPGRLSFALARESPARDQFRDDARGRWIEVFLHPAEDGVPVSVDVLTRQSDDYTNAIAEGVAAVFARYWRGTRDPE